MINDVMQVETIENVLLLFLVGLSMGLIFSMAIIAIKNLLHLFKIASN